MRCRRPGALALGAVVLGLAGAPAGGPPRPPTSAPARGPERFRRFVLERMKNELALTDEQVRQIKDLEGVREERMRAAGEGPAADAKRREAGQWFEGEVRKLLTAEQVQRLDAMSAAFPPGHDRGAPLEDFVERWKQDLELTDAQVEQIRALTPPLRQKLQEAGADRAKRTAAWQWFQTEVRALLTDAQKKKMDDRAQELRDRLETAGLVRYDWALRVLDLSEEQRRKVDQLRRERDRKVREAFEAFHAALKGTLTPEQLKQFEERLRSAPAGPGPDLRPPGAGPRREPGGHPRRDRPPTN